jgi:hypothetical protein
VQGVEVQNRGQLRTLFRELHSESLSTTGLKAKAGVKAGRERRIESFLRGLSKKA